MKISVSKLLHKILEENKHTKICPSTAPKQDRPRPREPYPKGENSQCGVILEGDETNGIIGASFYDVGGQTRKQVRRRRRGRKEVD